MLHILGASPPLGAHRTAANCPRRRSRASAASRRSRRGASTTPRAQRAAGGRQRRGRAADLAGAHLHAALQPQVRPHGGPDEAVERRSGRRGAGGCCTRVQRTPPEPAPRGSAEGCCCATRAAGLSLPHSHCFNCVPCLLPAFRAGRGGGAGGGTGGGAGGGARSVQPARPIRPCCHIDSGDSGQLRPAAPPPHMLAGRATPAMSQMQAMSAPHMEK